ncbi:DUF309 domain-containing protein [Deinococcus yavapaiensis]|uniref:DUF309 domain-containing protein n=1 Tax=Deinococcus yavapaiensis TaxID=309889 RepID=UPI000DA1CD7A|nr:DUF309 domain-containing protein [Deinococcus yavapaiensis]
MRATWREGLKLFNEGRYWEAHEAWEAPWRQAEGRERALLQALILLAAAMHKRLAHGSLTGRNYYKALKYVEQFAEPFEGVDVRRVANDVRRALDDTSFKPCIVEV